MRAKWIRILLSSLVLLSAFSSVSYAQNPVDPRLGVRHFTSLIMGPAPMYESASFNKIEIWAEYGRAEEAADKASAGELIIENGVYTYWDAIVNDFLEIKGETRGFPLRHIWGDDTYVEFWPTWPDGDRIVFLEAADGGLQGKTVKWRLDDDGENVDTIPDFRTTRQQLDTYVPFVELRDSGGIYRMASPGSTALSVTVPHSARYGVILVGDGLWQQVANDTHEPNTSHSGVFTYPSGVARGDITCVIVHSEPSEGPDDETYLYGWEFFVAENSNAGLPLTPMELGMNEVKTFSFTFAPGYRIAYENDALNPIITGTAPVYTVEELNIEDDVLTLKLKGSRAGSSDLRIAYTDSSNKIYYTDPVTVTVSGGSGGGGGGGCDAGYGLIGLLFLGLTARKYLKQ